MKRMNLLRAALGAVALLSSLATARADFNVNPATASTPSVFCGFSVSTVIMPCHVIVDSAKAEMFKATNPGMVGLAFGGSALTLGQKAKAASLPVTLPSDPDTLFASGTITTVDAGSTTATGQSGVSLISGTASAASVYSQAVNGQAEAVITVTGTWTGTLQFEGSGNAGAIYSPRGGHLLGTTYRLTAITGNGVYHINASGLTNLRVRATAWTSGTATIQASTTTSPGSFYLMNSVGVADNTTGNAVSIKPANTPAKTDNGLVVSDPLAADGIGLSTDAAAAAWNDAVSNLNKQMRLSNKLAQQSVDGMAANSTYQGNSLAALGLLHTDLGNTLLTAQAGSALASVGIPPVTASGATALVGKASQGNLYGTYATNLNTAVTGFMVAINAAAAPASGATIAPVACTPFGASGGSLNYGSGPPAAFSTGIVILITTAANCSTYTPGSASAFLSASVR